MYLWKKDGSTSLLCAGTDMRIRNWNLTQPLRSYIVCRGPADDDALTVRYEPKIIDGVEVTIEGYHKRKPTSSPPTATTNHIPIYPIPKSVDCNQYGNNITNNNTNNTTHVNKIKVNKIK